MLTPFFSSEEYDERAHKQYDRGDYDAALDTLKEGLQLYPHAVELHVGLGYTRLAREEFAWARRSFEKALVLDPDDDDARVGLGETLLRFGRYDEARAFFDRVRAGPSGDDPELLLAMGRALYRDGRFHEARSCFEAGTELYPGDPELLAALGFTLHRLGDDRDAVASLRAALTTHPSHFEARIYLAHLLYDTGDWAGALEAFAALNPAQHWDALAVWRLMELKTSVGGLGPNDPELMIWQDRLEELEDQTDPIDELLAEIEIAALEFDSEFWGLPEPEAPPSGTGTDPERHRVRLPDGKVLEGSWLEIVRQLRDQAGRTGETVDQFMKRWAEDTRFRIGVGVPADDAEGFLLAHARAGLLTIER
ncbi:MAG: tetratricopeptide repeat protein [Longimicrobiales bacterium]